MPTWAMNIRLPFASQLLTAACAAGDWHEWTARRGKPYEAIAGLTVKDWHERLQPWDECVTANSLLLTNCNTYVRSCE